MLVKKSLGGSKIIAYLSLENLLTLEFCYRENFEQCTGQARQQNGPRRASTSEASGAAAAGPSEAVAPNPSSLAARQAALVADRATELRGALHRQLIEATKLAETPHFNNSAERLKWTKQQFVKDCIKFAVLKLAARGEDPFVIVHQEPGINSIPAVLRIGRMWI